MTMYHMEVYVYIYIYIYCDKIKIIKKKKKLFTYDERCGQVCMYDEIRCEIKSQPHIAPKWWLGSEKYDVARY